MKDSVTATMPERYCATLLSCSRSDVNSRTNKKQMPFQVCQQTAVFMHHIIASQLQPRAALVNHSINHYAHSYDPSS